MQRRRAGVLHVSAHGVLRIIEGDHLGFWCPACEQMHVVTASGWSFDGNYDRPTFSPSILVTGFQSMTDEEYERWVSERVLPERRPLRCHSFVRAGQVEFLGDCTHALAGQTVALTPAAE
jgi:hypothetical protein